MKNYTIIKTKIYNDKINKVDRYIEKKIKYNNKIKEKCYKKTIK